MYDKDFRDPDCICKENKLIPILGNIQDFEQLDIEKQANIARILLRHLLSGEVLEMSDYQS